MRVSDGLWLTRVGATVRPSVEIAEALLDEKTGELKLLVATRHVPNRGATLNSPLITVTLSSPTEDVIKVKAVHFAGAKQRGPDFELFPGGAPTKPKITLSQTDESASLKTGGLEVRVDKKSSSFALDFIRQDAKGKDFVLTSSGYKSLNSLSLTPSITAQAASATSVLAFEPFTPPAGSQPGYENYMQSELSLLVGELIYGLGELFGPLVKNGQAVSIWNQDGGTSSQQGYKTIPFYLSNRGYGVFINEPGEVELEVGAEKGSRVGAIVRGESIEYYIINGPTMKDVLDRYTNLTGRPGLPPTWTFGLWLSTSFTTDYSEQTIFEFLEGMKSRNCPVRTFHMDCFWMAGYKWTDFTFDPKHFPDPKAQIARMKKEYGVKVCLWINPYIAQASCVFEEASSQGFLIKKPNGDTWQTNTWQAGMGIVDFTNPAACEWYIAKLETLLDLGVDAFKTDFGERIPHLDVAFHNGEDAYKVHNWYAFKYNKIVFDLLERRFGKNEACLFARSATAGGQQFPVHWGGDCASSWEAMSESLRGGLSLTMSGFGFWSHDIGGFEGTPPPAVFNRWLAFGVFSSHSRLHGSNSYRVPWIYGEDCADNLAIFLEAKHRLMPYIYAAAIKANETGLPIQRAMILDFEDDRTCHNLDRQYMFGDSLLVAPVFHESEASYYIPAGIWTDFWKPSRTIEGPRWVTESDVPFDTIPIFVRPNSVLPLGPEGSSKPDYDYTSGLRLQGYQLAEGSVHEVILPSGKGAGVAAKLKVSKDGEKGLKVEVVEGKMTEEAKALVF